MDIVTWNVNSLRARLDRVVPFLEERRPDVVCLQETKAEDADFPREPLEALGYRIEAYGQKSYNGVAILSRTPMEEVTRGFPGGGDDAERRVLAATIDDVIVVSVYVVNGKDVGHERYEYKLRWLEELRDFIDERCDMDRKVVICGDFNVTFDDLDVWNPRYFRGRILCSEPEREALAMVMSGGLRDAFRAFHADGGHYTWWDYRMRAFEKNRGLRIDHFLMSPPALEACTGVWIDVEARQGEKPSDHAPVIATLE